VGGKLTISSDKSFTHPKNLLPFSNSIIYPPTKLSEWSQGNCLNIKMRIPGISNTISGLSSLYLPESVPLTFLQAVYLRMVRKDV